MVDDRNIVGPTGLTASTNTGAIAVTDTTAIAAGDTHLLLSYV